MRPVRKTDGATRQQGHILYRNALSYQVLPGCVKAFVSELRAAERCKVTSHLLTTLPRWRRIRRLPSLWQLRRLSLQRRSGDREAKRKAWGLVWTVLRLKRIPKPPTMPPAPQSTPASSR